jgi:hypothetical protein
MGIVKMGVGGVWAEKRALGQRLLALGEEDIRRYERQGLGETVDREIERLRHSCGRLELSMWRTSRLFCKTR